MKIKQYVKLSGTVLAACLLILIIYSESNKKTQQNEAPSKKNVKETKVYVNIIKEKKPKTRKTNPVPTNKVKLSGTDNNKEMIEGELPPISANYRKYVGFSRYSQKMTQIGCRFFVIGNGIKNLYEIDFNNKALNKTNINTLKTENYSPKSRMITGEPALNIYLNAAKVKYDIDNPEIILLVPKKLERIVLKKLLKYNLPLKKTSSLKGYYKLTSTGMVLKLNKAIIGGIINNIDIEINID